MGQLLILVLYAFGFIAAVLAVEGLWLAVRSQLGDERRVNRRLRLLGAPLDRRKDRPRASPFEQWLEAHAPVLMLALQHSRAPMSATQLLAGAATLALLVGFALSAVGAPLLLIVLASFAIATAVPAGLIAFLAHRRRAKFLQQFPQAVDLMARSLQVGHPATTALTVVSQQMDDPISGEFGVVIEEITYGLDRDRALANLTRRFPLAEVRMFVASMQVTRETGGNLSEVFLKLSESIRAKANLRKKVEAISAEGRLSFWVVTALPLVVGGALMLLRPSFYTDVIHDPLFWPMMSVAPIMLTIGAAIIWRLVNFRI